MCSFNVARRKPIIMRRQWNGTGTVLTFANETDVAIICNNPILFQVFFWNVTAPKKCK